MPSALVQATMPDGFVEVTKEHFFAALERDTRDIMPKQNHAYFSSWETTSRYVWGWSTPGWRNPGDPKVFAIRKSELLSDDP